MRHAGEISCGNTDAYFGTVIPDRGGPGRVLNDAEKNSIHYGEIDAVVRLVGT
jgi:hypothetical protein